jgi:hypothetical protein
MKNNILIIFALIIVASCKPAKVVTVISEKIRIDTVRDYKLEIRYNAVHDTLLIENPCDSLGLLNDFYSKLTLPQGKIIIRSYRGKIQATVNIDSIRNVYESKYRNKQNSEVKLFEKIEIKTVYPSWLITALIFESLIILGYLYFKFIFIRL